MTEQAQVNGSTFVDARYIRHNAKSVDLIHHSAERGMSRRAMERIWPLRLLNLVLGHEVGK
jgi:hypothetical protein